MMLHPVQYEDNKILGINYRINSMGVLTLVIYIYDEMQIVTIAQTVQMNKQKSYLLL